MSETRLKLEEAVRRALALAKTVATVQHRSEADLLIPILARALDDDDELRALAERWIEDPASLGRRARDLAAELAQRVALQQGFEVE